MSASAQPAETLESYLTSHMSHETGAFMVGVNKVPTVGMVLSVYSLDIVGVKPREFLLAGNEITPMSGTVSDIRRAVGAD